MLPIQTTPNLVIRAVCSDADKDFLENLETTVLRRLGDPQFDVAMLANMLKLSRTQLTRKSVYLLGHPPGKYLLSKRLDLALNLLNKGNEPAKNVSILAGFQNYSSFWRAFTKTFGHSPSDYVVLSSDGEKSTAKWTMPPSPCLKEQLSIVFDRNSRIRSYFNLMLTSLGDERVTLSHFADSLCIGPSQLLRDVRSVLSVTPMKLLLHLRLLYAAELLGEVAVSIGEVAHRAGFFDQSHLSRAFKTVFGKSPSTYRKDLHREKFLIWLRNHLMQQDVMP